MISWYDHRGQHGWHDEDETLLEDAKVPMVSVGFVIEEDDHGVVIAGTYDTLTGSRDDSTVILKSAIQRRADIPLFDEDDEGERLVGVPDDKTYADIYDPPDGTPV